MNRLLHFLYIISLSSCSSFSKLASHTEIKSEGVYVKVSNDKAKFSSLTFGDFSFALNSKEFQNLNAGVKPPINCILVYAKTDKPDYEYFILHNKKRKRFDTEKYFAKDTLINSCCFTLLISKHAPEKDIKFIQENMAGK